MDKKRVGIVGAGQLGRMLALAGYPLGIACRVLDTSPDAPGAQVAPAVLGRLDDARALAELAAEVDVVTLEIENIAVEPLETLRARIDVFPPPRALAAATTGADNASSPPPRSSRPPGASSAPCRRSPRRGYRSSASCR